jgi:hypothetical protein
MESASCELMAISSGSIPFSASPQLEFPLWTSPLREGERMLEFYNVLWIERKEGVCYRKALGIFQKDAWETTATVEIDVILG